MKAWMWVVLGLLATAVAGAVFFVMRKKDATANLTAQQADVKGTAPTPSSPAAIAQTAVASPGKAALGILGKLGLNAPTAPKTGLLSTSKVSPKINLHALAGAKALTNRNPALSH